MSQNGNLDHRKLYRLPWSLTDNVISWLEPTKECNIYCDGCYSANAKGSHKTLEQIQDDLDVFERYRQTDAVSIAGGDPLVHPNIVEVVKEIARRGLKPVVNTNGHALTPEMVRELRRAGLQGFTFHVDSRQTRPGWKGKSEIELNALRLRFAEMVAEVGGISCSFNYEKTLPMIPEILDWGQKHVDKVHGLLPLGRQLPLRECLIDEAVRLRGGDSEGLADAVIVDSGEPHFHCLLAGDPRPCSGDNREFPFPLWG